MSDILEGLVMMTQYQGFYVVDSCAPLFKTEREAVEYLFPEVVKEIREDVELPVVDGDFRYEDGPEYEDGYVVGYDEGYSAARNAFEKG